MTLDPDVNDRKCSFRAGPTGATIAIWRNQLELVYSPGRCDYLQDWISATGLPMSDSENVGEYRSCLRLAAASEPLLASNARVLAEPFCTSYPGTLSVMLSELVCIRNPLWSMWNLKGLLKCTYCVHDRRSRPYIGDSLVLIERGVPSFINYIYTLVSQIIRNADT
jgi:hypothetical protein